MTASAKPATVLLDVPMTSEQLAEIEYAAALSGLDATQWALQNLLAAS